MKIIKAIPVAALILFAGCGTSKITTSWNAKNIASQQYSKVLVLGLIPQKDRTLRTRMEEHFVGDLKALGYNAVSSLQEYGPQLFSDTDEKSALEKLKNSGVDAVITIVLLDKKREQKFIPGRYVYQSSLWDYVGMRNSRVYEPGYYITDTRFFWETNFYRMDDNTLLYSVQTKTFSPPNAESMGHEYGQLIVKDMLKKKILAEKKQPDEE